MTDAFKIHDITDQPKMYCGPTVLALLTGKPREKIHRDINKLKRARGFKSYKTMKNGGYKSIPWKLTNVVKGMTCFHFERMFDIYKIRHTLKKESYPSLARMIEDMGHFKMPVVILVTGHFILYFNGLVYDTKCKQGAPIKDHPSARQRVKQYWIINKQPKASS